MKLNFENISRNEKEQKKDDAPDPGKRKFLKETGAVLAAAAFSSLAGKAFFDSFLKVEDESEWEKKIEAVQEKPTEEQVAIEQENINSIKEVLDFHKEGRIEINPNTIEGIRNNWIKKYSQDPKYINSLKKAYLNIGEWLPYLREQFRREGVDDKYLYLSIPESHWDVKAVSKSKAVGAFQIIPSTAKMYDLPTGENSGDLTHIDERMDPVKSARTCAKILKDLLADFNGNRDLALSGYNGSFVYKYKKAVDGKGMTYPGFLKFMEERINQVRDKLKIADHYVHKMEKGDTIAKIAAKYTIDKAELIRVNRILNENRIAIGQEIKIPLTSEIKKEIYDKVAAGMAENLVYPAKFDAVMHLIKNGFVSEQKRPLKFEGLIVKNDSIEYYTVQKGDTIYGICKRFKISDKKLGEMNRGLNARRLPIGTRLIVSKEGAGTLKQIAEKKSVPLTRLESLNPAIKNPDAPLKTGYEIRV